MPSSQNDISNFDNALTPRFWDEFSVNGSAAALPTIPDVVDILVIQSSADVRYIDNGTDDPTTTSGVLLQANVPLQYEVTDFAKIKFINTSGAATVQVLGYSYATEDEA